MSSTANLNESHVLSENTQSVVKNINALSADEQLALLYFVYEKMGDSITPAAPIAAEPELAPVLLSDFHNLSEQEQLTVMRGIINGDDTVYSRAYGALTANNKLVVWYAWAVAMGDTVVDLPDDYQATDATKNLLSQLEQLDFEQQISVLREAVTPMGYSDVKPIETQVQTGKTASL